MSTLSAVPDPATGSVEITVSAPGGTVQTLIRADSNGTRPVRLPADAPLPAPGTYTVRDHEASLSGPIQYRAATSAGPVAATTTLGGQLPRFALPFLPLVSVQVNTVFNYAAARESRATVHEVPGRPDPIIIQASMGTRRGTLAILCDDHTAALVLIALFARGQHVLYRQSEHAGMDMYFIPLTVSPAPAGGKWELTVSYVETAVPAGAVQTDPAWTFAALAATGGTFAAVATAYPDFTALSAGEPTP